MALNLCFCFCSSWQPALTSVFLWMRHASNDMVFFLQTNKWIIDLHSLKCIKTLFWNFHNICISDALCIIGIMCFDFRKGSLFRFRQNLVQHNKSKGGKSNGIWKECSFLVFLSKNHPLLTQSNWWHHKRVSLQAKTAKIQCCSMSSLR